MSTDNKQTEAKTLRLQALALAAGSLPASSVNKLLAEWSELVEVLKAKSSDEGQSLNTTEAFRLESMQWVVEDRIRDLRAELGLAESRQPRENTGHQPRSPERTPTL